MRELRQTTEVIVPIGPALSTSDGFTAVTTLALGGTCDHAVIVKYNTSATVSVTSNTFTHVLGGECALTFTTTDTNTLGLLRLDVQDADVCLPIWEDFSVVGQNFWDSKYSSDYLQVDVKQLDGNAIQQTSGHIHAYDDDGAGLATSAEISALNDVSTTNVQTYCDAAIQAYDPPTKGELDSGLGALSDITTTDVRTSLTNQGFTATRADQFPDSGTLVTSADLFNPDNDVVLADIKRIEGHVLAGSGTQVADGFEYFFNVVSPSKTMEDVGSGAELTTSDVQVALTNQGCTTTRAEQFPDSGTLASSAEITALENVSATEVQASCDAALDALSTSTLGAAPTTWTWPERLNAIFSRMFGKGSMTATAQDTYDIDGSTQICAQTVSDDGTTQARTQAAAP